MSKVWLITGASRGLGRAFTEAALEAGDRVVATARDPIFSSSRPGRHGRKKIAAEKCCLDQRRAEIRQVENFLETRDQNIIEIDTERPEEEKHRHQIWGATYLRSGIGGELVILVKA
jgi:NAD(P)-dependent dehydrogenase (short-subunit alcohol dehydrogenase family)